VRRGVHLLAAAVLFGSGCTSLQVTRAEKRFAQVRVGMTREEVEDLLGPPAAILDSDSPEGVISWSATVDRPAIRWINVHFTSDGRVARIEQMRASK
jgi:SmpA / OmlA family